MRKVSSYNTSAMCIYNVIITITRSGARFARPTPCFVTINYLVVVR